MAQLVLGMDVNDTDPEGIRAAYEKLRPLIPHVRTFNSDNPKMPYLNGEVGIGMIWNGDGYVAAQERGDLRFIWPEEGGIFWMDNFVIPKNAANKAEAHAFINWMLRADSAAAACEYSGYTTPNIPALELLPPEMRSSPIVFPPKDVVAKGRFLGDVGDAVLTYEDYWNRLKAGQ
jgi:spermidine/putrescine transport system substrate-binding protein